MDLPFCKEDTYFMKSLEWITISLATCSFIALCFVLKDSFKVPFKKMQIVDRFLVIIIISELINSVDKIISFIKFFLKKPPPDDNREYLNSSEWIAFIIIQAGLSVLSDSLTLLSSLCISLKIFDLTINRNKIFRGIFRGNNSLFFIIGLSILITLTTTIINTAVNDKPELSDRECKIWFWVYSEISLCLYIYYIIVLVFIILFSAKSIKLLKLRKEAALQMERDTKEDDEENKGENLNESLNSTKINSLIQRVKAFPIASIIIWIVVSCDRFPDDLVNIIIRKKHGDDDPEKEDRYKNRFVLVLKIALVISHNLLGCFRGIIYTFVHFNKNYQIFGLCKFVRKTPTAKDDTPTSKKISSTEGTNSIDNNSQDP